MDFLTFDRLSDTDYQSQVYGLLKLCDNEFVPPLSQRTSTTQQTLSEVVSARENGPVSYFEVLREQSVIVCMENGCLAGFMSFRAHHICEDVGDNVPTIYVTTVIVDPAYRGKGLTDLMYSKLLQIAKSREIPVSTRTWSTNYAHLRILARLGFYELLRIQDGRGPGIDTVYYRKDRI